MPQCNFMVLDDIQGITNIFSGTMKTLLHLVRVISDIELCISQIHDQYEANKHIFVVCSQHSSNPLIPLITESTPLCFSFLLENKIIYLRLLATAAARRTDNPTESAIYSFFCWLTMTKIALQFYLYFYAGRKC